MTPVYMVLVELSGDADRKRLDYVVEKYRRLYGEESIRKLCGGVLLVSLGTEKMLEFAEELYSRLGADRVKIWLLSEPDFELQPVELEETITVSKGYRDIWVLVDFLMTKYRGVLVSESLSGSARTYRVRTRYGSLDARFEVQQRPGGYVLRVRVSGYGPGVARFFEKIVEELSVLEG